MRLIPVSIRRRLACLTAATLAVVGIAALPAASEIRSPLDDANAIQRQLRSVAEHSAASVYAVTAFTQAPGDRALFAGSLEGKTFAAIADHYERACGTAFAIDAGGRLVTNEHVVGSAASVWVTDDSGRTFPALVIGTDPRSDLAILSIPTATMPLTLASSPAERGDVVLTLGNPDGQATDGDLCASVGNVSVADRSLPLLSERERRSYSHMIQTTTPIDVGSSGGPLLDLNGEVLGVVCAVATASDKPGRPPVGFATSLNLQATRDRLAQLARGEEIVYGYLGVMVSVADEAAGVRVDRVDVDTPAHGVLQEGDVVLRFDGTPITTDRTFIELAGACTIDHDVPLKIRRGAQEMDLVIRPRRRMLPSKPVTLATQSLTWAGVTFANTEGGVKVTAVAIDAEGPLSIGDSVGRVNGDAVSDLPTLLAALHRHAGQALELEPAGAATSAETDSKVNAESPGRDVELNAAKPMP